VDQGSDANGSDEDAWGREDTVSEEDDGWNWMLRLLMYPDGWYRAN